MEINLNIKTKFSIGDTIYFLGQVEPQIRGTAIFSGEVTKVYVIFCDGGYKIMYGLLYGRSVYEEEAFTSKDECRAHLSPEQLKDYTEWKKYN
jgi:hypothetical protein